MSLLFVLVGIFISISVVVLGFAFWIVMKKNKDLRIANIRLEELDRQKTEFLSIAAHQLRTPLSVVSGYLELIKEGAYGGVTRELHQILQHLDINNDRLVKLVDEFLNITKIEQNDRCGLRRTCDLLLLVEEAVRSREPLAEEKGLILTWETPHSHVFLSLDYDNTCHVIGNFLDNAIQYTERGAIHVHVAKDSNGATVRVTDTGVGFEESDRVNFFQKFYRGQNVQHMNVNYGTGLGLYIAKKFVENHGGKIWAKSEGLGKGSEFGFWLPMN